MGVYEELEKIIFGFTMEAAQGQSRSDDYRGCQRRETDQGNHERCPGDIRRYEGIRG